MRDGFASNFRLRFVGGGVSKAVPEAVSAFTFWELHSSPELIFSGCEVSFEELCELRFSSSNSPTSSSLWPSSSLSLSSSSLNSSLSVSFLLFHWSNRKTFDHTKLWWELIQTRRHNTFRRDIVAEICSLWARISWASWCCKGEYFLMEWEAQWLWIGSGTEWLWVWFWSYFLDQLGFFLPELFTNRNREGESTTFRFMWDFMCVAELTALLHFLPQRVQTNWNIAYAQHKKYWAVKENRNVSNPGMSTS